MATSVLHPSSNNLRLESNCFLWKKRVVVLSPERWDGEAIFWSYVFFSRGQNLELCRFFQFPYGDSPTRYFVKDDFSSKCVMLFIDEQWCFCILQYGMILMKFIIMLYRLTTYQWIWGPGRDAPSKGSERRQTFRSSCLSCIIFMCKYVQAVFTWDLYMYLYEIYMRFIWELSIFILNLHSLHHILLVILWGGIFFLGGIFFFFWSPGPLVL